MFGLTGDRRVGDGDNRSQRLADTVLPRQSLVFYIRDLTDAAKGRVVGAPACWRPSSVWDARTRDRRLGRVRPSADPTGPAQIRKNREEIVFHFGKLIRYSWVCAREHGVDVW
jgi:hypothetical protein